MIALDSEVIHLEYSISLELSLSIKQKDENLWIQYGKTFCSIALCFEFESRASESSGGSCRAH